MPLVSRALVNTGIVPRLEDHCGCLTGGGAEATGRDDPDRLHAVYLRPHRHAAVHGGPQAEVCPQLDRGSGAQRHSRGVARIHLERWYGLKCFCFLNIFLYLIEVCPQSSHRSS